MNINVKILASPVNIVLYGLISDESTLAQNLGNGLAEYAMSH